MKFGDGSLKVWESIKEWSIRILIMCLSQTNFYGFKNILNKRLLQKYEAKIFFSRMMFHARNQDLSFFLDKSQIYLFGYWLAQLPDLNITWLLWLYLKTTDRSCRLGNIKAFGGLVRSSEFQIPKIQNLCKSIPRKIWEVMKKKEMNKSC